LKLWRPKADGEHMPDFDREGEIRAVGGPAEGRQWNAASPT